MNYGCYAHQKRNEEKKSVKKGQLKCLIKSVVFPFEKLFRRVH